MVKELDCDFPLQFLGCLGLMSDQSWGEDVKFM